MSGQKNCPETPRQRMIGMMYLVLTAMLALNVSADILNGFSMVTSSLRNSIMSTDAQTASLFTSFQNSYAEKPDKFGPNLETAKQVKEKSDALYDYLQNFRREMIHLADGDAYDTTLVKIQSDADVNVPGNYGLRQTDEATGLTRAEALKNQIADFREFIVSKTGDELLRDRFDMMFSTGRGVDASGDSISWEMSMFEYMPMAAVNALLTRYQNDVRSAEYDLVKYLYGQTSAEDLQVNSVAAVVIPSSHDVMRGSTYKARIMLAAFDSTAQPVVKINGQEVMGGMYEVVASGSGLHTYSGTLEIPGDTILDFTGEYFVTEPAATISNVDLNVVYKGIDNKFSISVPGVPNNKVSVSVTGGTATGKGDGKYIVRATAENEITINVSADVDGHRMTMGSQKYRVKYLPDPKAYILYGGKQMNEGTVLPKNLKASSLIASYGQDELIEAKFSVVGFTMVTSRTGAKTSNSGALTAEQKADIDRLKRGDFVVFKAIKAKGPDGKVRNLGAIQLDL